MTLLTTLLCLVVLAPAPRPAQDPDAWKVARVAIVIQHSGAHRTLATAFVSLVDRILALRPEKSEAGIVGFDRDFEQLEGARYRRRPVVLESFSTDGETLREAVHGMVFHGPSPVWDAIMLAIGDGTSDTKPDRILVFTNGMDNASQTSFDALEAAARKAAVPITSIYFPETPTGGGDTRLKKLAKASGGRFIDTREKNSWESLVAALR
jgi:hypothetical protein